VGCFKKNTTSWRGSDVYQKAASQKKTSAERDVNPPRKEGQEKKVGLGKVFAHLMGKKRDIEEDDFKPGIKKGG